jgi:hypothetical protein
MAAPFIAPILEKAAEAALSAAATKAAQHVAENPGQVLDALGDAVIIKPLEKATNFLQWLTDKIPD